VTGLLSPRDYSERFLQPLGEAVRAMEYAGVPFDAPAARAALARVEADVAGTTEALRAWCAEVDYLGPEVPPNWGSWQQLQYFLYTPLGLDLAPALYWKKGRTGWEVTDDGEYQEVKNWKTGEGEGEYKTDDVALKWLGDRHPEHRAGLNLIRDLRWQLRVKAYLEKWLFLAVGHSGWWWLHPSFSLASDRDTRPGAVTGRFACKLPNLQQVPGHGDEYKLRELFRAPPGWAWVVIDFSQLEIVLLAHICRRLFRTSGLADRMAPGAPDMHSATARFVFGERLGDERLLLLPVDQIKKDPYGASQRDLIKPVRYGLNYGKGARGFGDTLFLANGEALGEERAQQVIDALFEFDPEIPLYQDWVRSFIRKHEATYSLYGRKADLPEANAPTKGLRNRAWRRALNYPLQAGGQEVTGRAMIACHRDPVLRRLGCRQVLQVHDEICFLVPETGAPEALERATHLMLTTTPLDAHLAASGGIATSWGEAK
jgi:DNA polymerase I